jgi:hypothetical protein
MFGRGVFLKGKNFRSIVIVVPLHVSTFYRVLKKLTAYSGAHLRGNDTRKEISGHIQTVAAFKKSVR